MCLNKLIPIRLFLFKGCNDNPTSQQFMGAYRKLLLHNEVESGSGANCLNDVTKVLEISSRNNRISSSANSAELEMLEEFDIENGIDEIYIENLEANQDALQSNSMAYIASIVEDKVIKIIKQRRGKACVRCTKVFVENEITTDIFVQFKSENSYIFEPCKSTVELISTVENLLKKYQSHNVTFCSMLSHIAQRIDMTKLYGNSEFGIDHNHKSELIKDIIKTYMNVKSTRMAQLITRMAQKSRFGAAI